MKGQHSNRAIDADIIRTLADNPGIRSSDLADKFGITCNTMAAKVRRLTDESRIYRQKQNKGIGGGGGYNYNLFTVHYARKHNVPKVYRGVDAEKSTLELQMMFHSLIRGSSIAV